MEKTSEIGVSQGSILGPVLFVLYINYLPQCLKNCFINMYVDDTVLYSTCPRTLEVNKVVQDDLNRVAQWMESNKLILNPSKQDKCSLELGKILPNCHIFVFSYTERL